MARDSPWRAGKYGREATSLPGETPMPHRIDTPVEAMESARASGICNYVSGVAELAQLTSRDDTVLALR